jgi:hypothetical protein
MAKTWGCIAHFHTYFKKLELTGVVAQRAEAEVAAGRLASPLVKRLDLRAGAGAERRRVKPVGPAGEVSCGSRGGRSSNNA